MNEIIFTAKRTESNECFAKDSSYDASSNQIDEAENELTDTYERLT